MTAIRERKEVSPLESLAGFGGEVDRKALGAMELSALPLTRSIDRDTVIPMERVTLSPKFQIVIPKSIREEMGLRSGQKLNLILYKNQLRGFPAQDIRELRGSLKGMNTEIDWDRDS